MQCLFAVLLALQSATAIDVQSNHEVTLALQMGEARTEAGESDGE
jgi:hypothetical protein